MKIFKKFVLCILFISLFLGPVGAIPPHLLDENCSDISDWTDADTDTAVSEVDPAGQFRFDTNLGAAGNAYAKRSKVITTPSNQFTIEIKTYFNTLGAVVSHDSAYLYYGSSTWKFTAIFGSDGLFIVRGPISSTEVGTNIVKCNGTAAWQIWRFEVNKTIEANATVEVFLDGISQGTYNCDWEESGVDGEIYYQQCGYITDDIISYIDYVKIALGLGEIGEFTINKIIIF